MYLGREGPHLAVFLAHLAEVHAALAWRRMYAEETRKIRRPTRAHQVVMRQHLADIGPWMHGNEVRGWRIRRRGRGFGDILAGLADVHASRHARRQLSGTPTHGRPGLVSSQAGPFARRI